MRHLNYRTRGGVATAQESYGWYIGVYLGLRDSTACYTHPFYPCTNTRTNHMITRSLSPFYHDDAIFLVASSCSRMCRRGEIRPSAKNKQNLKSAARMFATTFQPFEKLVIPRIEINEAIPSGLVDHCFAVRRHVC